MKRPRLIVGILVFVHLILAIGVFVLITSFRRYTDSRWIVFPLSMLWPAQGNLMGIWMALGGRGTPLRIMLCVVVFVVGSHYTQSMPYELGVSSAIFVSQLVNVGVLLLFLRLTGLELERPSAEPWQPRPFQFTIRQMMAWTATVAVVLSACHYLPRDFSSRNPYTDISSYGIHASCTTATLAAMWLAFGKRMVLLRILAFIVVLGVGTVLLHRMIGFLSLADFGFLLGYQTGWTFLSLIVIRRAGYQVSWHWRFRRLQKPSTPDVG
jgi:hypothetical protein